MATETMDIASAAGTAPDAAGWLESAAAAAAPQERRRRARAWGETVAWFPRDTAPRTWVPVTGQPEQFSLLGQVVKSCRAPTAARAYRGKSGLVMAASQRGFVRYARGGGIWVALDDPVGPRRDWAGLARDFVDLAPQKGALPTLMGASFAAAAVFHDAGLRVAPIGAMAFVQPATFDLATPARAPLCAAIAGAGALGVDVRQAAPAEAMASKVAAAAQSWAAEGAEVDRCMEDAIYLCRPELVVAHRDGHLVGAMSVLISGNGEIATIDGVAIAPDQPPGVWAACAVQAIALAGQMGARRIELGLAPLHRIAPAPGLVGWRWALALHRRMSPDRARLRARARRLEMLAPGWTDRYVGWPRGRGVVRRLRAVAALASDS